MVKSRGNGDMAPTRRKQRQGDNEPRAANGEGSVYKRESDGRWIAALPIGRTASGGVKRVTRSAQSERAAWKLLAKLQEQHSTGTLAEPSRLTVAKYLERWLKIKRPTVEVKTWDGYEQLCRLHLVPTLGYLQLSRLGAGHLKELYAEKVLSGLSAQRVLHIHRCIHTALEEAVMDRTIPTNPAALVTPPAPRPEERPILSIDQARQLIPLLEQDPEWGPLILLTLTTGLRESEICALRWQDLDLNAGEILVRQTITWPSRTARGLERKALRSRADEGARAEFVFKPRTKNGKPRRVPLVSSVAPVLQDLKRRQRELIMRERQVWEPHDLIFPAPESGRPLRPDRVNRNLKRILADADLPVIRFHDLRHSAASVLFALGCTAIEVAGILGHTTPAITLKLYGHLMPGATKGVATKLEGALFGQADDKRKANRPR